MKKILPIICICFSLISSPDYAQADDDRPSLPEDSRIRVLLYDESDVYTITTRYGYQTNLVFSAHEEISMISMGERSLWQIIPSGNRLFIRPNDDDITTNMTVITNKRTYQFDLVSLPADTDKKPLYVGKFRYLDEERKKRKPSVKRAVRIPPPLPSVPQASARDDFSQIARTSAPIAATGNNFNYTFSGPDNLSPLQVFDDGTSTFIKYRVSDQGLPKATVRRSDGSEQQIVYYINKDQMVVNEIVGEIILRYGSKSITIYNEKINPR